MEQTSIGYSADMENETAENHFLVYNLFVTLVVFGSMISKDPWN